MKCSRSVMKLTLCLAAIHCALATSGYVRMYATDRYIGTGLRQDNRTLSINSIRFESRGCLEVVDQEALGPYQMDITLCGNSKHLRINVTMYDTMTRDRTLKVIRVFKYSDFVVKMIPSTEIAGRQRIVLFKNPSMELSIEIQGSGDSERCKQILANFKTLRRVMYQTDLRELFFANRLFICSKNRGDRRYIKINSKGQYQVHKVKCSGIWKYFPIPGMHLSPKYRPVERSVCAARYFRGEKKGNFVWIDDCIRTKQLYFLGDGYTRIRNRG